MLHIYFTFSKLQSVAMVGVIADLNIVIDGASAAKHNAGLPAITAEVIAREDEIFGLKVRSLTAGIKSNFISFLMNTNSLF